MPKLDDWLHASKRIQDSMLMPYLRDFATALLDDGYTYLSVKSKLWSLADFGQWLQKRNFPIRDFDEKLIESFIKSRRQCRGEVKTLHQFLDHLRRSNIVRNCKPPPERSPLAKILNRYEEHLQLERGLVRVTIAGYLPFVRKFLVERFRDQPFRLRKLKASDVSDFVLRHGRSMAVKRAQLMTSAFRSFFRFLFHLGKLHTDLAVSVPTVANWRLSTVPKYLTPQEVRRVLKGCDRRTSIGRRDYAVLLLLARLGLRIGEVVALQLGDIDWRAGEIMIRGKGSFHDRMPLPCAVGEALTRYIRQDRPHCPTRQVFVCMRAPRRGFARSTVTTIVHYALQRANLSPIFKGAHLLRHSLATSMLRAGATMSEIGEVLRHRVSNTTEIYAKVDFNGLRSLTHPWPIGGER